MNNGPDERLKQMLSWMRPHNTQTECNWVKQFIMPYNPYVAGGENKPMAYIVQVGTEPTVLFSAHVDTVHRKEGKQFVHYDPKSKIFSKKDDHPLGADDAAGCWLLLEMIDAKVPGVYVFHRGEECGGIGSKWLAENCYKWLQTFDYAIAFDRKATHSVITHQGYGRCCSDDFAQALSDMLNTADTGFMYVPDDTGVYTDTAEYTEYIPECTNVSCGYYSEHTKDETLNYAHLSALRDACIKMKWHELPVTRKPGEDDDYFMPRWAKKTALTTDELYVMDYDEMLDMCCDSPEQFVALVREALFEESVPTYGPDEDVDEFSFLERSHALV